MADKSQEELAHEICSELSELKGLRGNLDSHWQEIAERIFPMHSGSFYDSFNTRTEGEKRTEEVFDSTGSRALGKFAAILDSLLTPRNQTWHRLISDNKDLNRDRQVKLWFEEVNRILFRHRYAPKANFTSQNQQQYKSLGAYGTGAMFIDSLDHRTETGLRYKNVHVGELYFMENHQGIIDAVYRYFPMKARQVVQMYGDRTPARIKEIAAREPMRNYMFIHRVKPNENMDPKRRDALGMEFQSHYVIEDLKESISRTGRPEGFRKLPYAVSRYEQAPGETYGRSPAMEVLPDIKTLNAQKKTVLKQGHRTVDPVILAYDDGVIDSFSLKPGAINYGGVSKDGRSLVQTLPIGNVNVGLDMMQAEQVSINDAFLVTLFQILSETPEMTATEVLERSKEKGILLAPTVGRQQSEYLSPMIERELDVLAAQALLPPMPPAMIEARGEYRIEYDSPMTRAQRAEEAAGTMRTVEYALNVVNVTQDIALLDHFDFDKIIPEISSINGMPVSWMKSLEDIQRTRAARAERAQMQQAIEAAPAVAGLAKATQG